MNRKRNRLISFMVSFIISFAFVGAISNEVIRASADATYSVSVTPVIQSKTNWCWAACAEMAASVVSPSSYYYQYSIVKYIYGSPINATGSITQSASGSEYACNHIKSFTGVYSTLSFTDICLELYFGCPVQAAAGYYNGGVRNGGHVVIIIEAIAISGGSQFIKYIDPANGYIYTCTYSQFCDGSYNGRIYDQTAYEN